MSAKNFLFFYISMLLVSCQSDPRLYFKAPEITPAIVNNCDGYKDGELIDVTNFLAVDPLEYNTLQEYYEDKELRLYICLKYKRRCR